MSFIPESNCDSVCSNCGADLKEFMPNSDVLKCVSCGGCKTRGLRHDILHREMHNTNNLNGSHFTFLGVFRV